jgi:diguanylate cyclase (GGDEF)-like protein
MDETTIATDARETEIATLTEDSKPELLEKLHTLLAEMDTGRESLEVGLFKLEREHQGLVYSELIWLLSHLRFTAAEATRHWQQVLRHRDSMRERLGGQVDLRVALVSYFVEVNRQLRNPKIIEMQLFERERDSAYRDMLTGLYNYRLFSEHLAREVFRADRYSKPLSLVMIDVDNFKRYNDSNGHEAGNQALRDVARMITGALRKTDFAARYGGDEFALVLPSTPKTSAVIVAERIRQSVDRHVFKDQDALPGGELSMSMGVATLPADAHDGAELVRQADRALYVAKAAGRNQVVLYGQSRRSFGRIDLQLEGSLQQLAETSYPYTTINVSEGGLLLRTTHELPIGGLIEFTMSLDEDRTIRGSGRVVHVERMKDGACRTAVSITHLGNMDRARLVKLIHSDDLSGPTDPA